MRLRLAQDATPDADGTPAADPITAEIDNVLENAPTSAGEAVEVVGDQISQLVTSLLQSLPILLIGLIVLGVSIAAAMVVARTVRQGVQRTGVDRSVAGLLHRMVRLVLLTIAVLFSLSVMGVSVANVVTVLAVLGFAIGLALQGILQNFVAGLILLLRKPFRTGDQIITGDYEGTVEDIDFRVTRLLAYDGTVKLVPNAMVFDNPLINLTERGRRRTTVTVGVDYRDDHDRAREVIGTALAGVDGVLGDPPSEVLLTELADSSVNFELRYWTAPKALHVRQVQDRVLRAVKSAIEAEGMTIPWPIRTLVVDGDSEIQIEQRRP
jgi:small conductance mechanosensitive channel